MQKKEGIDLDIDNIEGLHGQAIINLEKATIYLI